MRIKIITIMHTIMIIVNKMLMICMNMIRSTFPLVMDWFPFWSLIPKSLVFGFLALNYRVLRGLDLRSFRSVDLSLEINMNVIRFRLMLWSFIFKVGGIGGRNPIVQWCVWILIFFSRVYSSITFRWIFLFSGHGFCFLLVWSFGSIKVGEVYVGL